MSYDTLPYLVSLRTTFDNVEPLAAQDPTLAFQISAAKRLIDFMTVQQTSAQQLRLNAYASLQGLLPKIGERLPELVAVAELKAICSAFDASDFDRFLLLARMVERRLFTLGDPGALALCRSIAHIEGAYFGTIDTAVCTTNESAKGSGNVSGARNTRDYDEAAVLDFIRAQYPDEKDLKIAKSGFISGGYSKFTVSITLENAKSLPADIIMRADASATYGGASTVEEYRLIKTLYEHGVRVPRPLAVEESGKVFGSKFLLLEKKPGISVGHMFILPAPNKTICRDLAEQLAILHRIPVAAFGDRIDNAHGRTSDKMRAWLDEGEAAYRPLDVASPAFEAAFEWLRRNADINDEAPRTLVHGDVHLANILVHENRISTILDWEFAHIGNPAYDLGYFYDQAVALDSWDSFLAAYADAGGHILDQRQLDYAILFAATRLGVMTCQSLCEFASGAKPALAGAVVIGSSFYEKTIVRISRVLDRVL